MISPGILDGPTRRCMSTRCARVVVETTRDDRKSSSHPRLSAWLPLAVSKTPGAAYQPDNHSPDSKLARACDRRRKPARRSSGPVRPSETRHRLVSWRTEHIGPRASPATAAPHCRAHFPSRPITLRTTNHMAQGAPSPGSQRRGPGLDRAPAPRPPPGLAVGPASSSDGDGIEGRLASLRASGHTPGPRTPARLVD